MDRGTGFIAHIWDTRSSVQVKARPTTREVVAIYTVEEVTMELVVTLPPNHPLGTISVECGKRIGVANQQWRNWMLQMTTFLSHQVAIVSCVIFLSYQMAYSVLLHLTLSLGRMVFNLSLHQMAYRMLIYFIVI